MNDVDKINNVTFPKCEYVNFLYYFHDLECENIKIVYRIIRQSDQTITLLHHQRKRKFEGEEKKSKIPKTTDEIRKEIKEEIREEQIRIGKERRAVKLIHMGWNDDDIEKATDLSMENIQGLRKNREREQNSTNK